MSAFYDMCVDKSAIIELEDQLKKVNNSMYTASQDMIINLSRAKGYLGGNQFNKADAITTENYTKTILLSNKISDAIEYLVAIENLLDEYSQCLYED